MDEIQTISSVLARLNKAGYVDDFRAEDNGLRAISNGDIYQPEDLIVDEIVRFEGETSLDDEAAIFALRDPKSGLKGTYTVAYSTDMDLSDVKMVQKLR